MTSPDGINWTSRSASSINWKSVTYGNGLFVAVSSTTTTARVMTSSDGITWTNRTTSSNINWSGVAYGNGQFVAVAPNSVMTSPDGITWTARSAAAASDWKSIRQAGRHRRQTAGQVSRTSTVCMWPWQTVVPATV